MRPFELTAAGLILLSSLAPPSASAEDHRLLRRAAYCSRLLDTGFNRPAEKILKLNAFIKFYQHSNQMPDELVNPIGTEEANRAASLYWGAVVTQPTRFKLGDKLGEEYEYCKRVADNPSASEEELRASRDHDTQSGSSAPSKPEAALDKPIIKKTGRFTAIDYGHVGSDFVLPMPSPLPDIPFSVEVDKRNPGLLWRFSVTPFGQGTPPRNVVNYPASYHNAIYDDYREIAHGHNVIVCEYEHERGGLTYSYTFWFKENPPKFDRTKLESRVPDHPLLLIGDAKAACPATKNEAERTM